MPVETLRRVEGERGEVVLRRRETEDGGSHLELVVDGVFAMDDVDTTTERALATEALARCPGRDLRVLVGGLGLGWTAAAALADPRVATVDVVELQAPLVAWAAEGLLPALAGVTGDPRLRLHTGDVADALAEGGHHPWDVVLLDVDNGPGFLIHPANEALYGPAGTAAAMRAVRPGGVLALWSSTPAPQLRDQLADLPDVADAEQVVLHVDRDGRRHDYALVLGRRAGRVPGGTGVRRRDG
jgi:spermidine synthase